LRASALRVVIAFHSIVTPAGNVTV
jgi:hypothetical protein